MKIYVYTVQHDLIHFDKHTFIADSDKQANEYILHLRERLLATGEAEAISGPYQLNCANLIDLLVPTNISGKPYEFTKFNYKIKEANRKSWRDM